MRLMWRRLLVALVLLVVLGFLATLSAHGGSSVPSPAQALPGTPAPPRVVAEIRQAAADAVGRFHAMDAPGVLAHVSDRYRSGPLTKPLIAEQLRALFTVHDQLQARVRIDVVRMIGEDAWIYSTGHVTGRLRWIGGSVPLFSWQHAPEVARREAGRWRLIGDQPLRRARTHGVHAPVRPTTRADGPMSGSPLTRRVRLRAELGAVQGVASRELLAWQVNRASWRLGPVLAMAERQVVGLRREEVHHVAQDDRARSRHRRSHLGRMRHGTAGP